jgi:hypothetical protein
MIADSSDGAHHSSEVGQQLPIDGFMVHAPVGVSSPARLEVVSRMPAPFWGTEGVENLCAAAVCAPVYKRSGVHLICCG